MAHRQSVCVSIKFESQSQDRARGRILLHLLEDMMYEPLYDELRTKQQLGYSVGCNVREAPAEVGPFSNIFPALNLAKGVRNDYTVIICSLYKRS